MLFSIICLSTYFIKKKKKQDTKEKEIQGEVQGELSLRQHTNYIKGTDIEINNLLTTMHV